MKQFFYGLAGVILLVASSAFAAPPAKEAVCRACHGDGGAKPIMDVYPKLNGQNKGYLVAILKSYRSGERKGGQSAVMNAQAKMLSDDDIEALATYYSSQK
ncbi:c-type cytochrome [Aliikangiella marina]|uniref:C-type cytochrome n=1 Tax=Aliikangiella marina TaxID=1712262 RepID=A0A545T7G5_9GAMM|nr:c-type cytochrome [Aliikangiella marina]TQV73161.1 c-type cytochrome [Aliikangiella marina]